MTTYPPTQDRQGARERLLAAADELFYAEGVHTVGIDRVIERAGVAKATLYNTFGSKDELVRAYLSARQRTRQGRISATIAKQDDPREAILAVFDLLDRVIAEPGYRGCAFLNASAESRPEESVQSVCSATRGWIRGVFADLARRAGAAHPAELAAQLVLLYDGAMVSAQLDGNKAAARTARVVAAAMVDAGSGQ